MDCLRPKVRDDDISFIRLESEEQSKFGPSSKRSKTDVGCLYLFASFLVVWIIVGIYATATGDINRLMKLSDLSGRKCGIDSGVLDKPYLTVFSSYDCDPVTRFGDCNLKTVCVKECPSTSFYYNKTECNQSTSKVIRDQLICKAHVNVLNVKSCDDITELVERGECSSWYFDTTHVARFCLPSLDSYPKMKSELSNDAITDLKKEIESAMQHDSKDVIKSWVRDFLKVKWYVFIALIFGTLCALSFIVTMRWLAKPIILLSIFLILALFATVMCVCFIEHNELSDESDKIDKNLKYLANVYFFGGIAALIALVVLILVLYALWKQITLGIALVEETSKAVESMTSTVFFPFLPWLCQILITAFSISVSLLVMSHGSPKYEIKGLDENCKCDGPASNYFDGGSCIPETFDRFCKNPETNGSCASAVCSFEDLEGQTINNYLQAVNTFGFIWSSCFISAFTQSVLAMTFSTWYWTFNKKNVPFFVLTNGTRTTARFHLGTIAFGSFLVALFECILKMIKIVKRKMVKGMNADANVQSLTGMYTPLSYIKKLLVLLNRNAYIMMAIHGKPYCESARTAFELVARNILRFATLNGVAHYLFFISKLLLTCGAGGFAFVYFNQDYFQSQIQDIAVPVAITMIGTFLIANVFFGVYSMAVDTIFLCFLEDTETNDGSEENPYFMSKKLMSIFGKNNLVSNDEQAQHNEA